MDDEAGKMNGHHMDDNGGNVYVVEMCEELNVILHTYKAVSYTHLTLPTILLV